MDIRTRRAAPFSRNPDYDFEIRTVLGASAGGGSDPGEVLAAVGGIGKHDHAGWFRAWHDLGERTATLGRACAEAGHRVSAADAFLRASLYFGVAVNAVSALADSAELVPTFRRQLGAWDSFVAQAPLSVDRLDVPFQPVPLPGWFFRPAPSTKPRLTLVLVNGSDGSRASLWASTGAAALRRGYNVFLFDGPGQQSQLFDHNIPFRPDWENVLAPVHDVIAAQDGVDPARIAVYGISQAGYWVARALAFEHRFCAAITDPGVVDVSQSWVSQIPKSLVRLLDRGEVEKFDHRMTLGMKLSPEVARTWQFRARPYGTSGYAETLAAVRRYTVRDVAGRIRTPLLITSPDDEQFWPGQSEELASLAPGVSKVIRFTAAEGAAGHCQPLARTLATQRMFDWLETTAASAAKS